MKLYYFPQTRATRPRWALEEIGAPYEIVRVDLSKGEHSSAEYKKIHPHGKVPALVDGDLRIFESAAICAYLADRFPKAKLAPPPDSPDRAPYYQWLFYAMATVEAPILDVFLNTRFLAEPERDPRKVEEGRSRFGEITGVLERALADREFLVGDSFSVADLLIGSMLSWSAGLGLLDGHAPLDAYAKRMTARPAYARATAD